MSNEFIFLLGAGLSSCSVSFNGRSAPPPAFEGTTMVLAEEPTVWVAPCSVGTGTRFTVRLDGEVGTDSSRPGEPFTAHVVTPVVMSCHLDFIYVGAVLRGRVVRAEPGDPPVLALELVDVDTSLGPKPIAAASRSGAGFAWLETSAPDARSSYQAVVVHPLPSHATQDDRQADLTLPAGGLVELELLEPVLVLP
jgi:hypothetical protein